MATQFHVIHSNDVHGVGLFAGVPYGCALGLVLEATNCMVFPGLISLTAIHSRTATYDLYNYIDPRSNLNGDKVFIFHGNADTVVKPESANNVRQFYTHYGADVNMYNMNAEHCMPTDNFGGQCDRLNTDNYINNCNYRGAYQMLNFLYSESMIAPPADATPDLSNLYEFDQEEFFYLSSPALSAMDNIGYVYIPKRCAEGSSCKLHIAFHGCLQAKQTVGDVYVSKSGYLEVAEANNIVVLFPQAIKTLDNPNGCWDWWGYVTALYDTHSGNQVLAVKRMMDKIVKGNWK